MFTLRQVIKDEETRNQLGKKLQRYLDSLSGWFGRANIFLSTDECEKYFGKQLSSAGLVWCFKSNQTIGSGKGLTPISLTFFWSAQSKRHCCYINYQPQSGRRGSAYLDVTCVPAEDVDPILRAADECLAHLQNICPRLAAELAERHQEAEAIRRALGER